MKKKNFENIENVDKEIANISGPVALGVIIFAILAIIIVSIICISSSKRDKLDADASEASSHISVSGNDVSSQYGETGGVTYPDEITSVGTITESATKEDIVIPSLTQTHEMVEKTHEFLDNKDYPEIAKLINRYYKAYESCSVKDLTAIVDYNGGTPITSDKLEERAEIIEKYDNIRCYIIEGLEENTYVVYAYYNIKFYNIDAYAPTLTRFYVVEDKDNDYMIYNGEISGKLSAFLNTVNSYTCVKELSAEVDDKLEKACDDDKRLGELMKILYE